MQHSGISKSTKWPALAQPLSSPLRCSRSEKYVLAGQTKPGEFPEPRLSTGFFNDVRRSRPDADPYLYLLPFAGFARRPTLPRSPDFSQALSNGQAPDSRPTQTKSAWSASLGSFPCR